MSASLVGSEMCIRDRYESFYAEVLKAMEHNLKTLTKILAQKDDTPHAVSYTHLTLPTICSV
eukprot:9470257-Alexandrium_andersonii.AAC.1